MKRSPRVRERDAQTMAAPLLAAVLLVALVPPGGLQAQTDVWIVPVPAEVTGLGTPIPVATRVGYENQPAFSATGRRLYFTANYAEQTDIWAITIDDAGMPTGEGAALTRTPESEYSATEMPSGGRFSVIRVEADQTQRLWSFRVDGTDPRLVLTDVAPVGYHAWGDENRVAMFVLGSPATLVLADARDGSSETLASDIGRSLHKIPSSEVVSFTARAEDGGWWISALDLGSGEIRRITRTTGDGQDYAWFPDGSIVMADGNTILRWTEARGWRDLGTLDDLGDISRLAVHPSGRAIAVVAAEPSTSR